MATPDPEESEQPYPMRSRFEGQSGDSNNRNSSNIVTWSANFNIKDHVVHFLTSVFPASVLKSYKAKLEGLKKCSFYIEVIREDLSHHDQSHLSNSTLLHLIDPWRFQRMKKVGNSQVKIQLSLLEDLYEEMCRGRQELEVLFEQCNMVSYINQEALLLEKIGVLMQLVANFDKVMVPGGLHIKHRLISDLGNSKAPQIRLAFIIKMHVVFDRSQSVAFPDSVILHWCIAGQEQHEPGEQFEVSYKLLQPENSYEGSQMGTLMCATYCMQINNLMPDKCYEFTVKRVDSCSLVYGAWNDSISLRTASGTAGQSIDSCETKEALFPW
ncbi:fibronectin type III domain-containing protein 11-like [Chanos chanos]|uniref:Fibronectin type III domain-containing protein 11-like n=1 Tax=Chanos chanos TaxID=29144 RepID=A0A6J2VSD3_CHACN|nr:fibronectin type III domain-containing protein 11 [Chanos chanos]